MSALDDHNRQHTYGSTLGPPTSVAGVSAQQAIDNQKRLVDAAGQPVSSSGQAAGAGAFFRFALIAGVLAAASAGGAYVVGGIGAFFLGLLAVVAGLFVVIFLISALLQAAKR